jgi:L-histidine N-alpha-methyltransferase
MAEAASADGAEARVAEMLEDVREGLARPQKELSPKYFYDARGSELFERITELPEYYPSRTERALLEEWMPVWIPGRGIRTLVELGAGSAAKTRVILDAMATDDGALFVPIDVSAEFLRETAAAVRTEYPSIRVVPLVADISNGFDLPESLPRPVLHAFLGSTIGNFSPDASIRLLRRVREEMQAGDCFLLGVDLDKDPAVLEAAYNDVEGVTAEFNLNVLRVLNRELGARFDVEAFRHRASYDRDSRCIEMHLVSDDPQRVEIPGIGWIDFRPGETILTEHSCKYDRASVEEMFADAGLVVERWETDAQQLYALVLAGAAG